MLTFTISLYSSLEDSCATIQIFDCCFNSSLKLFDVTISHLIVSKYEMVKYYQTGFDSVLNLDDLLK